MKVEITKGQLAGWSTYHIFDNDDREICLHRADTESLVLLLQSVLNLEQEQKAELLIEEMLEVLRLICNKPNSPIAECPADISDSPCICGFHDAQNKALAIIAKVEKVLSGPFNKTTSCL